MSHFTYTKTQFQSLFYLEKALNKLNIDYKLKDMSTESTKQDVILPQSQGSYDLEFHWNGQEYEFVIDYDLWTQAVSPEKFLDNIAYQYTTNLLVNEGQTVGFQPVTHKLNEDGSTTLILERWKN